MTRPSLFEIAGGEQAFLRLAAAHHARCLEDPVLNHPFSHPGHPQHLERLASYWAEVFGGPPRFSLEYGDQSAMLDLHARTGADDDLGSRFVECFAKAIDDCGLPDDPEFRSALRSYGVGDERRPSLRTARRRRSSRNERAEVELGRSQPGGEGV